MYRPPSSTSRDSNQQHPVGAMMLKRHKKDHGSLIEVGAYRTEHSDGAKTADLLASFWFILDSQEQRSETLWNAREQRTWPSVCSLLQKKKEKQKK